MSDFYCDTHCHLDLFPRIEMVPYIENAHPIKTISVTNAPFVFTHNVELFKDCRNIRVALGLHPELAFRYEQTADQFESLIERTRYIGEIGIDGSTRFKESYTTQYRVLDKLLSTVASASSKILTVHSRGAAADIIELIHKKLRHTGHGVILHWYTGDQKTLLKALEYGFFFSVNHKMLVSAKGRAIAAAIRHDRLLTETDAPFTFDAQVKDRITSLKCTVDGLAHIHGISTGEMKHLVFNNFKSLLGNSID